MFQREEEEEIRDAFFEELTLELAFRDKPCFGLGCAYQVMYQVLGSVYQVISTCCTYDNNSPFFEDLKVFENIKHA